MDIIAETDKEMKKLPANDRGRIFWEIITGQRPPQKLADAVLEATPPITETKQ